MLIPLVARAYGESPVDRDGLSAWALAIRQLRSACGQNAVVDPEKLVEFLDEVPHEQRWDALLDLVSEHLMLSWRSDCGRRVEDYLSVLSTVDSRLASISTLPADLVEDEFLARYSVPFGDAPSLAEYRRRFANRDDVATLLEKRHVAAGRFVMLRKLGVGSVGDVWEGYDRRSRSFAAVKMPRPHVACRSHLLSCLAREAEVTSRLDHPGIVNLRECRVDNSEPLYVMRLASGCSFLAAIKDFHDPPSTCTADERRSLLNLLLTGLACACDAMDHAHSRGVVHCDLTPANIVLTSTGEPAILDWGFARRCDSPSEARLEPVANASPTSAQCVAANAGITETRVIAGTPDYMAPEQIAGTVDVRTDVFGLGAVLYEVLAGRAPYSWGVGGRPADWSRHVQEARFARPRRWNSAAPRALETVCIKAMARDPGQRYTSMAELAEAIRRYASDAAQPGVGAILRRAWRRLCARN